MLSFKIRKAALAVPEIRKYFVSTQKGDLRVEDCQDKKIKEIWVIYPAFSAPKNKATNIEQMKSNRKAFFIELYQRSFPAVARYVARSGGKMADAKDVFHDALIIFYEKTLDADFQLPSDETAYLLGISRNLWCRHCQQSEGYVSMTECNDVHFLSAERELQTSSAKIMNLLERSGRRCMEMLKAFYYEKLSIGELAAQFGYKGERSATVQKYKCLEKVRDTVKQKSLSYEDFLA